MRTFFMVYVSGGESPKMRHDSCETALKEATRLSKNYANEKEVYVLQAVSMTKSVVTTETKPLEN